MVKRIRIFFINCPKLDVEAASFLILAQNLVQSAIQFEVLHFWDYGRTVQGPLTGWFDRILFNTKREDNFHNGSRWRERRYRTHLDLRAAPFFEKTLPSPYKEQDWEPQARAIIAAYDQWHASLKRYQYDYDPNGRSIIITETPLYGKYISYSNTNIGIHSAADWRAFMGDSSISAIEYLLAGVQRLSLRLCYGGVIGTHWPTRGCLWDFDRHQPDAKINVSFGNLCETCRQKLKGQTQHDEFEEIIKLIKNKWIGKESRPGSIAATLKRDYNYSISRSTGLRPGVWSVISDSATSQAGKFIVTVVQWVLVVVLSLLAIQFFPDTAAKIKSFLSLSNDVPTQSPMTSPPISTATPTPSSNPDAANSVPLS